MRNLCYAVVPVPVRCCCTASTFCCIASSQNEVASMRATGMFAWAGLALLAHSAPVAVGMLVVASLSTACSDVVVDSIVVERSRGESQVGYVFQATGRFLILESVAPRALILLQVSKTLGAGCGPSI